MVAAESKGGRWGGKTGMYVRKNILNYDAIIATEDSHNLLMFHHQD